MKTVYKIEFNYGMPQLVTARDFAGAVEKSEVTLAEKNLGEQTFGKFYIHSITAVGEIEV